MDYENVKMRLATLPGAYVGEELRRYPEAVAMFLGSYGGVRGECVIAVDISRVPDTGEGAVPGAQPKGVLGVQDAGTVDGAMGLANANGNAAGKRAGESGGAAESAAPFGVPDSAGQGADDAFDESVSTLASHAAPKPTLLQQAVTRFDWVDLRGFAPHANAREAGQATSAVTLSIWHSRQRFCPTCGAPVLPSLAGWAQRCSNQADGNRILFPRASRRSSPPWWTVRTVCCCSTMRRGKTRICIRCLPDSWKRGRTLSMRAGVRPAKKPAFSWARCGIWDHSRGHSPPR